MVKKILVCDDDEAIADMMKIMLESNGSKVKILSSGKGIQKRIKEYKPDLILLDIWMPGIDGKEAASLLKKDPEIKHIPVIIISALHENEIKKMVKEAEVEGYLLKPFSMSDLLNLVVKYT